MSKARGPYRVDPLGHKKRANEALDKMAENAKELGLDYGPAQQEPVAWLHPANATCVTTDPTAYARGIPLYTSPPAQRTWVGLTDDEIYSVLENLQVMHHRPPTTDSRVIFAKAIEAKLKEKNNG